MKACFNGCSFTVGEGFPENLRDDFIYDRLVSNHFQFDRDNIAVAGSSNYTIFMRSARALQTEQYGLMFVQWSALNRLWLSPGPDTYFTITNKIHTDFKYRDLYFSSKEVETFKNMVLLLNHDYQNILDLIDYCSFLNTIAKQTKTKIIYINGLVPWTNDLTVPLDKNLSKSLSDYSKSMIEFDHRDDHEIVDIFSKLQEKFQQLDTSTWVNVFDSFLKNIVDHGPEGHHPGIKSHQLLADKIINYIKEKNIL